MGDTLMASLFRRQPPVSTGPITAAAVSLPTTTLATANERYRSAAGWQATAWRLWRTVGVLHYPTSFMADAVSRVRWDVVLDGETLEETESAKIMRALTAPMSVGDAARRLALNLEVAGEVFYGRIANEWRVYASTAPKLAEARKQADVWVRGWLSDPVDSDEPDSPVRAALDTAEEIRILEALSRAQTRNRLAGRGIVLVPNDFGFPDGFDFSAALEEAISAAIQDEHAASSANPIVVYCPAEFIEKWRHFTLDSDYDEKLHERLADAIRRLALALNMPPEIVLGNADASRWIAWMGEESFYRHHGEVVANLVGQTFARAIVASTSMSGSVQVLPDPSELLARRQSVSDAFRAMELGVVGPGYVRRQMGADDQDAPTPEELEMLVLLRKGAGDAAYVPTTEGREAPIGTGPNPVQGPPVDQNGSGG